jgi:hypothetical protein
MMEVAEFIIGGFLGMIDLKFRCECIVGDERVYHFSSFGFHGMFLAELVLGDVLIVKIANLPHK